jgi:hypothetical protein
MKVKPLMQSESVVYPFRVQAIRSRDQKPQLYLAFPTALVTAIALQPAEAVQWQLLDRRQLRLVRLRSSAPTPQPRTSKKASPCQRPIQPSPISYPFKVQLSRSHRQHRLYVGFPLALAVAIALKHGEAVQWELRDGNDLRLVRPGVAASIT